MRRYKPKQMQTLGVLAPPPYIPRVPHMAADPLQLKISATGVTYLKDGSYRTRLTGGECVADINGRLHLSRNEYKKFLTREEIDRIQYKIEMGYPPKKSRGMCRKPRTENLGTNNLKTKNSKTYTVNKKEVTNRLQCMTGAMFAQVKQSSFLGMLTISFPPAVDQHAGMQALNTWLTAVRDKIGQYLWVSEFQQNGTIHYHLLILKRVNIVKVNRAMRVTLCNMIRDGVIKYSLAAMKRYQGIDLAKNRQTRQVTNFCNPKSRRALTAYITKYVTKNNGSFLHAAWGCSRAFSAIFTGLTCTIEEFKKVNWMANMLRTPVIENEWFKFYAWLSNAGPPQLFTDYLNKVNGYILQAKALLN